MPRPKVPDEYIEAINYLVEYLDEKELKLSHVDFYRRIRKLGKQMDWEGCPSDRSIRRYRNKAENKPKEERKRYRYFYWPEAMESGVLPWEATRPLLDLLAHYREEGIGRPTLAVAKWYWYACEAIPEAPAENDWGLGIFWLRLFTARHLAFSKALGSLLLPDDLRRTEWWLAYAPWRSLQAEGSYEDAGISGPRWSKVPQVKPDADSDKVIEAFERALGELVRGEGGRRSLLRTVGSEENTNE